MRVIKCKGGWLVCGIVVAATIEEACALAFDFDALVAQSGRLQ
jgi:hypothetical protein